MAPDGTETNLAAAYNPAVKSWRLLPLAPAGTYARECENGTVWTSVEMLTWGAGGAAFDPVTNQWRRLPPAPISSRGCPLVVWTGREMIAWGGGCCGDALTDGAAYTPVTNAWEKLPPSPLAGRHAYGVWTGTELIILGGTDSNGKDYVDGAAYDPTRRSWRRIAPMPAPRVNASTVWDGTEVLVVGGWGRVGADRPPADVAGLAYNPATNRWRRLPVMETGRTGHVAVWTGSQLLVWGGVIDIHASATIAPPHGLAYDPLTNRWSAMPVSPLRGRMGPQAAWTGATLIIWGGWPVSNTPQGQSFLDGASYTPGGLAAPAAQEATRSPAQITLAAFMDARMHRDAVAAKPYLSAFAYQQACEDPICIPLIGLSNPHYVAWEVVSKDNRGGGRVVFMVRIHEGITGQGETDTQFETIEIGPGENYLGQIKDGVVLSVRR